MKKITLTNLRARIAEKHSTMTQTVAKTAKVDPKTAETRRMPAISGGSNPVGLRFVKPIMGTWVHQPGDQYRVEGFDLKGNPLAFITDNPILAKRTELKVGRKWGIRTLTGVREVIERVAFGDSDKCE
jgi:hypothetical protein